MARIALNLLIILVRFVLGFYIIRYLLRAIRDVAVLVFAFRKTKRDLRSFR